MRNDTKSENLTYRVTTQTEVSCVNRINLISRRSVYYAVQGGSNFKSVDETLVCDHSNESY